MSLRLRRSWLLLLLLFAVGCTQHARAQAARATLLAEGANALLVQLGDRYGQELVDAVQTAAATTDAASATAGVLPAERTARRAAAIDKAKADVITRWAPIWGTPTSPGLWPRLRAAHDAWATRLEAGESVPDEVADPQVRAAFCGLFRALPASATSSIHLPEGLLCP